MKISNTTCNGISVDCKGEMKISNTTCNGMSVDCEGMSMDEITSLENKYMHMYHCVVRACPNTGTILIHTALPLDDVDLAEIDTRKAGSHVVV